MIGTPVDKTFQLLRETHAALGSDAVQQLFDSAVTSAEGELAAAEFEQLMRQLFAADGNMMDELCLSDIGTLSARSIPMATAQFRLPSSRQRGKGGVARRRNLCMRWW